MKSCALCKHCICESPDALNPNGDIYCSVGKWSGCEDTKELEKPIDCDEFERKAVVENTWWWLIGGDW